MIHNQVNEMLHKPVWTMEELLAYYERVGRRDRSPVWTKEDMNEVDYRSFVKGFLTSAVMMSVVGGVFYFFQTQK